MMYVGRDAFTTCCAFSRKTVVVGAGYIAVELAGILNALGSETRLVIRRHQALRNFDSAISENVTLEMQNAGIAVDKFSHVSANNSTIHKIIFFHF